MAAFRRRNLISELCTLLEVDHPLAYCDACLAFRFRVSLFDAKAAAIAVSQRPGFTRQRRTCSTCARTIEVTSVGMTLRRP